MRLDTSLGRRNNAKAAVTLAMPRLVSPKFPPVVSHLIDTPHMGSCYLSQKVQRNGTHGHSCVVFNNAGTPESPRSRYITLATS